LEALGLHLERASDREGGSSTVWCADYWQGGSARPEGGGGGSQRSQKSLLSHPECTKRCKNGQFNTLIDFKISENVVFYLKVIKYTLETFFKGYVNLKIFHYPRHCGVISVQSFGSHIRPQPPD
jgi:hypothetical protein